MRAVYFSCLLLRLQGRVEADSSGRRPWILAQTTKREPIKSVQANRKCQELLNWKQTCVTPPPLWRADESGKLPGVYQLSAAEIKTLFYIYYKQRTKAGLEIPTLETMEKERENNSETWRGKESLKTSSCKKTVSFSLFSWTTGGLMTD